MSNIFSDSTQIGIVSTFSELVNTDFKGEMNALCWYRNLEGDFNEIVAQLRLKENITEIYPEDLIALQLSEKGNIAREIILNDLQLLADFGASPSLNLLNVMNVMMNLISYRLMCIRFMLIVRPLQQILFYVPITERQVILFLMRKRSKKF